MSLERFEVKGNIIHPIVLIGFTNFILMFMILIMSTTIFARPSGVQMEFPFFKEGVSALGRTVDITISSENVIFVDGKVVTINELRRYLAQGNFRRDTLMINVDRRASMGRVSDILDICRGISGASVNVSTIL